MRFKGEVFKFLVLLLVALGAGPVGAAMWQWSTTANSNATADPTINWSEGMSPSSVNDSARAMMAATAAYRNDLAGITTTGGSPTAYTLTSNQGGFTATSAAHGFTVGFIVGVSNGAGGVTLNVDGAGAVPLRALTGVALSSAALVTSQIRHATYIFGVNEWRLHDITSVVGEVPIGAIIDYAGGSTPSANFVEPQNQCLSTTTYATLFGLIGHTYSGVAGCPGGTFGLPDTRGRVIAAADTGVGRLSCSDTLGCGVQTFTLSIGNLPSHQHTFSGNTGGTSATHTHSWVSPTSRAVNFLTGGGPAVNNVWQGTTNENTSNESANHTHPFNGFTDFTGGGAAFSIVQPTITMRKLMRVL